MGCDYFKYINNFKLNADVRSEQKIGNEHREETIFTIAIPTYKRLDYLKESLDSSINQRGNPNYEIIVVDNDPEQSDVEDMIRKLDVKNLFYYRNEQNIGMFGNWNRCIELAKGKYITILNDDDLLSPNFLERCAALLNTNVDGLIFRNHVLYEKTIGKKNQIEKFASVKRILRTVSRQSKKLSLFDYFLGNKSAGTLGVLMKTEYLKELGGYNPDYFPSSDYVLHANFAHKHNVYLINKKLNYYRVSDNESANQETLKKWETIDNEIREYFMPLILRNPMILLPLNRVIQDVSVKGLIDNWNYETDALVKLGVRHQIFKVIISFKNNLNI